ncbi:MFS transporter [Advenella sp. FME57]|uniref:MFS transporter n=1 Tax=Advenella sp. FME57 TaxID=2742604 RepID=UPI0018670757|nr:MFS transporter [Advenella sp. FME57]
MNVLPGKQASTLILTALAGAMLLASLGVSIATVALPALMRNFNATLPAVQWVMLAYLITITVAIVLAGKLGDLIGHRRVLIVGLTLFVLASGLCAAAPTLDVLVLGRVVQGVGGATLMALPISIVHAFVTRERIGSAMGLFGTMSAIGTALGPSLGGVLIGSMGWRAAFIVLTMLGAGLLIFAARVIPAVAVDKSLRAASPDWTGAALLTATLILYGLGTVGGQSNTPMHSTLLLVCAAGTLVLFLRVQSRAPSPLVPLAHLRDPLTGTALLMNLLVSIPMMATLVIGPFFLSFGLGLNEAGIGLVMAVGPLVAAISGVPAGRLADRIGAQRTRMAGLIQTTLGLIALAYFPRFLGVAGYIMALILLTPGFQLFLAANSAVIMLGASQAQRGLLSGLLGLSRNLGLMTGASLMSGVFAMALGPQDITGTAPDSIAQAFTITFVVIAGICLLALILSWCVRPAQSKQYEA